MIQHSSNKFSFSTYLTFFLASSFWIIWMSSSYAQMTPTSLAKEPIAFIGHGAMYDQDGSIIKPTMQFVQQSQEFYIDYLSRRASDQQRQDYQKLRRKLLEGKQWNAQTQALANSALIQWLIDTVRPEMGNRMMGKIHLLNALLHFKFDHKGEIPHGRDLERFEVSASLQNEMDAIGLNTTAMFSTTLSGDQYVNECRENDVPTPPNWGSSKWIDKGTLTTDFLSISDETRVYAYESALPPGMCIALPRSTGNTITALGIICLGQVSSKACFWDNQNNDQPFNITKGDPLDLSEFAGGAELKNGGGGVCTDCHAGENPYVIHPNTALGNPNLASFPLFANEWYDPLVHPDWPQNAGPLVTTGACSACHTKDGMGGRFPILSTALAQDGGFQGYCQQVLNNAITQTMPPGNPGDPNYSAHASALQGLCNSSPSPQIRIEEEVINFGDVELGFSFRKALVVHNDGDAALTFSVSSSSPINNTIWPEITMGTNLTVNPGDAPIVLSQIFEPQSLGTETLQLQLTSSAIPAPQTVTLTGRGISPIPLDSVLVMDRSGSMNDQVGDRRKIDAMQIAANLYSDLLRENINNSGTGDKLGFVKYNATSSTYMTLDFINPAKRLEVQDKLSDSALNALSGLKPDGGTGIGGAMEKAADLLLGIPAERKQAMVVLTDGKENESPYINDVKDGIQDDNPNVNMYAIGLGTNIEPTKLQNITNVGNGYHQVSDNLAGVSLFDLETFYFKIFANATGMDLVVDPTHVVNLLTPDTIAIDRARIVSSDRTATFLVLDDPVLREFYDLEFISPKGQVIKPGVTIGGIPIQESQRHTYRLFRIIFPDVALASTYVGNWVLQLTPNGKWSRANVKRALLESDIDYSTYLNPFEGLIPIGFAAAVRSDYKLQATVSSDRYLPGATVRMTASLSDRGWPALDGLVNVTVSSPGGLTYQVPLYEDGTHGDLASGDGTWTNHFLKTTKPNVYKFLFRSKGKNDRGEFAPREASRYVTLKQPESTPTDDRRCPITCLKKCIPCLKKCLKDMKCS